MTKNLTSEPDASFNQTVDSQQDTAPAKNSAANESAGVEAANEPTVTIKGVSGKKITGVVKVVKPKKEASEKREEEKSEAAPAAIVEEPKTKAEPATKKPGVPGKVGNIFEMRKAQAEEEAKKKAANEAKSAPQKIAAEPRKVASGPRKVSSGDPANAPKRVGESRPGDKKEVTQVKPAPKQDEPAAKKPGTPGKVGNIFESKRAANSSLAATVEMHAQRMARKKQRQTEAAEGRPKQQQQRGTSGGRPGGRPPQQQRSNQNQAGRFNNRPPAGFPDKDKDEEQPKFQSRPRRQAKQNVAMPPAELLGRAARDTGRRNNRYSGNRRNDEQERGGRRRNQRAENTNFDERRSGRGSQRRQPEKVQAPRAVLTHVSLPEQITVKEFAEAIKKTTAEVIKALMKFGVMATINQVIDYDTASIIAGEFDITTEQLIEVTEEDILFDDSEDREEDLQTRPPVVVVMGHVDHGKTSLLDYYRNARVASGEAGGITQHIGAYMVRVNDRKVTFLDTPGHEAFTTMRARGAMVTDIAILVVAADDGVMPQTVEAINHAKAANTEVIVAINKIDKEDINVDRIKQELSTHGLIPEEWGGSTIMIPVSAKTGQGMEDLLEMVLLTADVLDLKANPNRQAKGTVIEAKLDRARGPVATLLVQRGTLEAGGTIVTGSIVGNVRAMSDANGNQIKKAGPSVPVEIIGLPEVPEAGEIFYAVEDERMARQLAERRRVQARDTELKASSRMSLDTLFAQMAEGEVKDLNIIVKADVQGSVEAVIQSLERLSNDEIKVKVIHGAVGAVTESDIRLAEVSNAIVIGFNVRPGTNVEDMAKDAGVDVRLYRVIYNAIEDIEAAMKGMLDPEFEEVRLGSVELRDVFKISSVGTVGGGYVTHGKVTRSAHVRVVRDGIVVAEDEVQSLRRFKDDVREVAEGYECGITLEKFSDLKVGDIIEAFEMREIKHD